MADDFQKRFSILADRIDKNLNEMVRKVGIVADQTLVLSTPVDEGTARSNWQVALDAPIRSEIPPYAPGKGLGIGESANAQGALAQGQAAIGQYKNGQTIYISNNLPYINRLNDGWSAQAPAGFVEKAVQLASDVIRRTQVVNKG